MVRSKAAFECLEMDCKDHERENVKEIERLHAIIDRYKEEVKKQAKSVLPNELEIRI